MSIIGDILKSISKPGRDIAELGRLISTVRSVDPSVNRDLDTLDKRLKAQKKIEQYQPRYQTQEEQLGTFLRPVETTLRNAATVGSLVAPVGMAGNIASRAGAGALGGGLASYGMTPITQDTDIMKILGGAALGGAVGGTIGAVEKGLASRAAKGATGKVSKFGKEMRGEAIGLNPNKLATKRGTGINSATQGKKTIDSFLNTMDELGIPVNTSEMASVGSDDALAILGDQFKRDILGRVDDSIVYTSKDTGRLVNKIQSAFKNNPKITQNAQYQELVGDLLSLGDNYRPSQLNMVREKARELINWASTSKSAVSERASRQVFNVLDDFFKQSVPGSADVLGKMKDIYTVRPFLQAKAPTAGAIKVGTASTNISVPSGALQERIPAAIGTTLEKGVNIPKVSPSVLQALGTGGIYATRLGQALGSQGVMQEGIGAGGQVQMPGGMVDEVPEMSLQQTQGEPARNGINLMLAQGILSGKISASEAEAVLSLLGMSGAGGTIKQTEAQRDYQLAAEAIEQAYGVLEQTGGAGKLATAGGNIAGFFGATSPSSEYRAALDTATAFLRKALIGSGQSEAELKNLNLPKPTDEPALARQKILTLIPLLRARAGLQEY